MFAYCGNSPILRADIFGTDWVEDIISFYNQLYNSAVAFANGINEDFNNFDLGNNDEEKVLDSHYFSAYKGVPVIRTNFGRSGTFLIMFLSRREDKADTVRHEYGHTVQMKKVGALAFIFAYAIPSILNKADNYYDEPCEITADLYGHVQKRQHSSKDIARGRIYERNAAYWGKVVSSMLKFFSPVPIPE